MLNLARGVSLLSATAIFLVSTAAHSGSADERLNAFSISYANVSVDGSGTDAVGGVNLKYFRYAEGTKGGLVATLSAAASSTDSRDLLGNKGTADIKFGSVGMGPLLRLTDVVSVYATAGVSFATADMDTPNRDGSRHSVSLGGGMRLDLSPQMGVDIGYEANWLSVAGLDVAENVITAGLLYRF